jgi:hypothetical protein
MSIIVGGKNIHTDKKNSESEFMQSDKTENITREKRSEHRHVTSRCYRIEIKLLGVPVYQFRLINVTDNGASILIKDDSAFLNMIEVDQVTDVTFISPEDSHPSGRYKINGVTP